MPDTQRTKTDLLTNLFQEGQTRGISAQDMRDMIASVAPDYAGMYFITPAVTSIAGAGAYVKAAGTTQLTNSSATMDNDGTANRLRYIGTVPRHFHVVLQASVTLASGNNQDIGIQLYKYDASGAAGAALAHSEARTTIPGQNIVQITSHADVMMDTNDYIEMHVGNNTAANSIQVEFGYVFCVSMIV